MKIALTSDTHTEFYAETYSLDQMLDLSIPKADADVLILAGDILCALDIDRSDNSSKHFLKGKYLEYFQEVKRRFPTVLMVIGNHEHYRYTYQKTAPVLKEFLAGLVTILDGETYTLPNGEVVWGGTMWTDFNKANFIDMYTARSSMNDYRLIRNEATYRDILPEFILEKYWEYKKSLESCKPSIVITHHAPSYASINEKWVGNPLNSSYANSGLDNTIMELSPRLWVHGHLHDACDYIIGNTRVVCNPRGYHSPGRGQDAEDTGYDEFLTL